MNPTTISIILFVTFVVSAMLFIWFIRKAAQDLGQGKNKLTKEQKAMKQMGANF